MITCCNGCVPPKRNGYCHTYCEEYLRQRAAHETERARADEQRKIDNAIYYNRSVKVEKALRYRRNKKL